MTDTEKNARRFFDSWQFWMIVAYIVLALIVFWNVYERQNNRKAICIIANALLNQGGSNQVAQLHLNIHCNESAF